MSSKIKSRKRAASYDSDDDNLSGTKRSKGPAAVSMEMQKDDDGNEYWEISKNRRVQVSDFKGKYMINIREFYEKDGKALPGKKV